MNLNRRITPNRWIGGNRMEVIVIHWWDDPSKKPSLGGVVNWLTNAASQVSAHYVVSGNTVYQLAEENDITWHARDANPFSIGIEVDPNTPPGTYETLGELVRDIRSRRGNLPLKRHSDYVQTGCPGSIDLARIDREAKKKEDDMSPEQAAEVLKYVLRVLNSEVKGWDSTKTHNGDYDKKEKEYLVGLIKKHKNPATALAAYSQQAWDEGQQYRRNKRAWKQAYDNPPVAKPANIKTLSKGLYEVK
jgi:hypothetical protein